MPKKKVDFACVRTIALDLPHVEESITYRSPCFKALGKLMACIAIHKSAEPDTLAVRVDFDSRAAMIEEAPDIYYLTDHYVNYPFVLVRMNRIEPQALKDLLGMAWRLSTRKIAKITKTPARKRTAGPVSKQKPRSRT
jgi:hypothetical protein